MHVTDSLLQVFKVDKQLRGLQSRLKGAEKFLAEQDKELGTIESRKAGLEGELKALAAKIADAEGECKRIDARVATLRSQMDTAQTNKQYQAFNVELATHKTERERHEAAAMELMTKSEELKKQLAELSDKRGEREKVRKVAVTDREARFIEIESKVNELKSQRTTLVGSVPADALKVYERLLADRGDEAMAAIEVVDRKRHEYHCGSCMMSLPMESVSGLLASGKLTRCPACQCALYLEEDAREKLTNPKKK